MRLTLPVFLTFTSTYIVGGNHQELGYDPVLAVHVKENSGATEGDRERGQVADELDKGQAAGYEMTLH